MSRLTQNTLANDNEAQTNWFRRLELLLLLSGMLLIGIYLAAYIHRTVLSGIALYEFDRQRPDATDGGAPSKEPDFSLWSAARIQHYRESLAARVSPAVAVLRITKIKLEVPVLDGTDDLTLNRAVGLIAGTAKPGEGGNVGIAGHRDGFFRGLKDVQVGDQIELSTVGRTDVYTIDRIAIVSPDDVSVLAPRARPTVTLVTCYPFYFVGSAPQRYIVQASIASPDPGNAWKIDSRRGPANLVAERGQITSPEHSLNEN